MEDLVLRLEFLFSRAYLDFEVTKEVIKTIMNYYQAEGCLWDRNNNKEDAITMGIVSPNRCFRIGSLLICNPRKEVDSYGTDAIFLRKYMSNLNQVINHINTLNNKVYTDSLTEVYNTNALADFIQINRKTDNVGVAFIDANGLGVVNNLYGHDKGDELLKTVSRAIAGQFRKSDIYRKSGDEFIIISTNINEELFKNKIEMIKEYLKSTEFSASIGCVYSKHTEDIMELITLADEEMYKEKELYHKDNIDKYAIVRSGM